jgi:protein TonB
MTPTAWTWNALAASLAIHGAAIMTALRHPSGSTVRDDVGEQVAVQLEPLATAAEEPVRAADPAAGFQAPKHPGHRPPYSVPPGRDGTLHLSPVYPLATPSPAVSEMPEAHAAPAVSEAPPAASERLPIFVIAAGLPANAGNAAGPYEGAADGRAIDTKRPVSTSRLATPARLLRSVSPMYPPEARAQGLEGQVVLEIVVAADGTVASARAVQRLGLGLDDAAIEAVKRFLFAPATREGRPVPIRMRWLMEFRLQ